MMNSLRMSAVGMVTAVAMLAGCERSESPAAKPPDPTAASAQPVLMAECLPCNGHRIKVTEKTARVEHEGKTYYFCTEECREEFVKNPDTFLKSPATQPAGM